MKQHLWLARGVIFIKAFYNAKFSLYHKAIFPHRHFVSYEKNHQPTIPSSPTPSCDEPEVLYKRN